MIYYVSSDAPFNDVDFYNGEERSNWDPAASYPMARSEVADWYENELYHSEYYYLVLFYCYYFFICIIREWANLEHRDIISFSLLLFSSMRFQFFHWKLRK